MVCGSCVYPLTKAGVCHISGMALVKYSPVAFRSIGGLRGALVTLPPKNWTPFRVPAAESIFQPLFSVAMGIEAKLPCSSVAQKDPILTQDLILSLLQIHLPNLPPALCQAVWSSLQWLALHPLEQAREISHIYSWHPLPRGPGCVCRLSALEDLPQRARHCSVCGY